MRYILHICTVYQKAYIFIFLQYFIYGRGETYGVPPKKDRKESENKTIRFPLELIDRINMALVGSEVSFSSFVIQACDYALENMEKQDTEENK